MTVLVNAYLTAALLVSAFQASADDRQPGLRGQVTDPQSHPLPGAQIWVATRLGWVRFDEDIEEVVAVTDPEGRFSYPGWHEEGVLVFCAEGYLPEILDPFGDPGELRITLQPGARLSGRIVDSEGKPVKGAEVEAITSSNPLACERLYLPCEQGDMGFATSNGDGWFTIGPLEPGWFDVAASANGYLKSGPRRIRLESGQFLEGLTLVLPWGTGKLAGRLLDQKGNPIPGAKVEASGDRTSSHTVSDSLGWYRLSGIAQETIHVFASVGEEGEQDYAAEEVQALAGENHLDLTLVLTPRSPEVEAESRKEEVSAITEPSRPETTAPKNSWPPEREVRGRIVSSKGEPLEAWLDVDGGALDGVTRPDGTFSVRLLDGEHTFSVSAEDHREATVTVKVDGQPLDDVVIQLERGLVLRGRILGSTPGDVFELEIQGPKGFGAKTDQEGAFYFGELGSGDWKAIATVRLPPDYPERKVQGHAKLSAENREASLDLDFRLGNLSLAGRVVGSRQDLQLLSADGAMSIDGIDISDAGAFQIDHLQPGLYRLRVVGTSIEKQIKVPAEKEAVIDSRENH